MIDLLLEIAFISEQKGIQVDVQSDKNIRFMQIVTKDPDIGVPELQDTHNQPLSIPYLDPPLGGYIKQKADREEFYWDNENDCTDYCITDYQSPGITTFKDIPRTISGETLEFQLFVVKKSGNYVCPLAQIEWRLDNHKISKVNQLPYIDYSLFREFLSQHTMRC